MLSDFRLDHGGIAELLVGAEMVVMIAGIAHTVAENTGSDAVEVETAITDRAAAYVTIKRDNALSREAKKGVLIHAAGAAGLEVRSR